MKLKEYLTLLGEGGQVKSTPSHLSQKQATLVAQPATLALKAIETSKEPERKLRSSAKKFLTPSS
jgi:hypothetical protein